MDNFEVLFKKKITILVTFFFLINFFFFFLFVRKICKMETDILKVHLISF